MEIGVIEGVVMLGPAGNPAPLSVFWQRENVKIGRRSRGAGCDGVMVPERRPEHAALEKRRIHLENCLLIFAVRAAGVSIVPQHQPEVRGASASIAGISIT